MSAEWCISYIAIRGEPTPAFYVEFVADSGVLPLRSNGFVSISQPGTHFHILNPHDYPYSERCFGSFKGFWGDIRQVYS